MNDNLIKRHVVFNFSVWKFYLPFSPSQLHKGENKTAKYEYKGNNSTENIDDNLSLSRRRR